MNSAIPASTPRSIPTFQALEPRILLASNPVVTVGTVTSSTASLSWNAISGATACRVYMAPEPPATPGAALPGEVLVATLAGTATSYQITGLAPAIDTYMRVEVDNGGGTGGADVYAKTVGGPLTTLDSNHIREVHMLAPNVLELIYADNINHGVGNDGPTLESGSWTITRADGTNISVTNKYRFSRPVNTPVSVTSPGVLGTDDNNIDTDHTIFLVLGANVGSRDVLTIAGPLGISIKFLFSDQYTETPVIQVNQVGYNPRATVRWAYIGGYMGDGGGLSLSNFPAAASVTKDSIDPLAPRTTQISSLAITLRSASDTESGGAVDQIDLSTLPAAEGVRYRVRVPGVGVSWPTEVSNEAAFKAFYTVTRGLYYNRWAGDLSSLQWTEWTRPVDHVTRPDGTSTVYTQNVLNWNDDGSFNTNSLTGARQVIGGHHDAGDWDIKEGHTTVAQLLLRAVENNPGNFTDNQLTTPQSGNGIPDLLDEALWEVQEWEALQEADGGVRGGVQWAGDGCRGYYFSNMDANPWFTYAEDPQVTARMAGIFAQAAYLVKPYNAARSAQLQTEAINAYNYAKNTSHKDYNGASAAASYMMYGSGELYRLTGNTTYKSDFEADWNSYNKWGYGPFDAGVLTDLGYAGDYTDLHETMPDFLDGYLNGANPSATIVSICKSRFESQSATSITQTLNDHAYRSSRPAKKGMDWGNNVTPAKYMDQTVSRISMSNISGCSLTAQQQSDYFNSMSLDADYVLGCNPAGLVYISGLGSRHTTDNLDVDMIAWEGLSGMPQLPGIPEYGPIGAFPGNSYYLGSISAFYPATTDGSTLPPAYRFGDTKVFVDCSEFDVTNVNAPLIEMFANLLPPGQTPPASYLPGGFDARNPLPSFGTPTNRAPVVEAGWTQTVTLPVNTVTLAGQVADDHFAGTSISQTWSKVSGPGSVTFGNANSLTSTVSFSAYGTYTLQLRASDTLLSSTDPVTIIVNPYPFNWTQEDVADSNTLALYHFNETSGTTAVNAQGTTSRNLTLGSSSMITSGTDFLGRSSYFLNCSFGTATSAAASIPTDYTKGLTIDFWMKTSNQGSANFTPVTLNTSGNNQNAFSYHPGWGSPYRPYMANVQTMYGESTDIASRLLDGKWHNVDLTHDPSTHTATLSVDNVLLTTWVDSGGSGLASAAQLILGTGYSGVACYIDELLVEQSVVGDFHNAFGAPAPNAAPVVNAGSNQTVTMPFAASLTGSVSDDGNPNPPGTCTYTWTKTSGPGTVTFGNAGAMSTTATFSASGTYVLRLTASDSAASGYAETTITVNPASGTNQAPTVSAGANQTVTLPGAATLSGTATDDGLPNPPASLAVTWTKTSGPGTVTFGNAGTASTTATFSTAGTYVLRLTANDSALSSYSETTITVYSSVRGRQIFYNDSYYDGYNSAANAADDSAIATDKSALLPGGTATFSNYTSYNKGINGIMVDVAGLAGTPTLSDISFKVGNSDTPSSWASAPHATFNVRSGAGLNGSSRVTVVWNDGAMQDEWLQVTVKATAVTGLQADDVFYFGNAIGESGDSASSARVDAGDVAAARQDLHKTFANPAPVTNGHDYNRDHRVTTADEIIARMNMTTILTDLRLISPPVTLSAQAVMSMDEPVFAAPALQTLSAQASAADSVQTPVIVAAVASDLVVFADPSGQAAVAMQDDPQAVVPVSSSDSVGAEAPLESSLVSPLSSAISADGLQGC